MNILWDEPTRALVEETRDFVKNDVPADLLRRMDREEVRFAKEFIQAAARRNLLGLRFPKQYGGRGLPWTSEIAAIEEVGVLGTALGCNFVMPSIVGEALNTFGTEEQKKKYLAPIIRAELFSAEALTEPRGGSDFFGATCTAVKDGNEFVLRGYKRFVVGGEGADVFLVYARTDDQAPSHKALSAFMVERSERLKVEYLYGLMGTRGGGTARIMFDDLRVPQENLIGPLNGGGLVFNRMMVPERLTSAAGALGAGRAALEVAARYTNTRKAFGQKIREFQGVNFQVAESVTRMDAARALTWVAAKKADSGEDPRRLVSEAKKMATQASWDTVNAAMQIMGGIGYTDVYPIERLLRDGRLSLIWTGTNEIMNLLIQHEYYKELEKHGPAGRDIEGDAISTDSEAEKVFE
ncbi:MAG: acyl-CoA/acyl-ACP dehydrogenase [Deltaproteobacteria bacterium]|nr:acyl-CoA/acyl-ACP dehydrogenase [Deltaproteobacteria bacterium]